MYPSTFLLYGLAPPSWCLSFPECQNNESPFPAPHAPFRNGPACSIRDTHGYLIWFSRFRVKRLGISWGIFDSASNCRDGWIIFPFEILSNHSTALLGCPSACLDSLRWHRAFLKPCRWGVAQRPAFSIWACSENVNTFRWIFFWREAGSQSYQGKILFGAIFLSYIITRAYVLEHCKHAILCGFGHVYSCFQQ